MRRSHFLLVVAVIPIGVGMSAYGCSCSPESSFESICDWVADPNNCYREFRAGMLAEATGPSALTPGCTFPGVTPTPVDLAHGNDGTANGAFLTTGMLGTCIINSGGSVTIAPPINLAAYPPGLETTPITYTLTFLDEFGVACGTATYTSPHGFSISIAAPAGMGGSGGGSTSNGGGGGFMFNDAGADGAFEATPDFGTYTQTISPGLDEFNVSCPSGEIHFFNLDESGDAIQSAAAETPSCPGYSVLVPSAALNVDPGGVNRAGAVSFSIVFPDTKAVYPPLQTDNPLTTQLPKPQNVVYFNCTVPAGPPQCLDGVKDGAETDVDCGGPSVNGCPTRCLGGQGCLCNNDCASDVCFVDVMTGMRVCYDPTNPPTNSQGGTYNPSPGVGKCTYSSVCNGVNDKQCSTGCTDISTDVNNCGSCGHACMTGDICCASQCTGGTTCGGAGTGAGGAGTGGTGMGGTGMGGTGMGGADGG
jgi:hypothetical protein